MMRQWLRTTGCACLLILLAGCVNLHDVVLAPVQSEPEYDRFHPYYVELCAVSQIRAQFARHGSSPGHAVMYLKGVRRSPATHYPTLELCDEATTDLSDPQNGVGISVNKTFKNVNWMAVPGKKLFYYGNLEDGQVLDKAHAVATIKAAAEAAIFNGIEVHEEYHPPAGDKQALIHFLATETLGTDFALSFGRTVFCTRLPVTRSMMAEIVAYLNGLNREYATGKAVYRWSGYSDNCAHTLRNSLAAADVWKPKSVRRVKLLQLLHLSVPANEFADLALLSTEFPLEDPDRIYRNPTMRRSLLERSWLPTRHGALVQLIPVHPDNQLYDTRVRLFVLENPLFMQKSSNVNELYADWRYTGLAANLRYFRSRYRKILAERPSDWNLVTPGDPKSEFRKRYYEYIQAQLDDATRQLIEIYPNQKDYLTGNGK